jgi:hypothetical protein
MPVVALCPRCRAVLLGTGRPEHCRRCGENVVAVQRALCSHCGQDCSTTLRVEPKPGEVYCHTCWTELYEAGGQQPLYPCSLCGYWFPGPDVRSRGTRYFCTPCLEAHEAEKNFDPERLLAAAEEAGAHEPVRFQPAPDSFSRYRARSRQAALQRQMIVWCVIAAIAFGGIIAWVLITAV